MTDLGLSDEDEIRIKRAQVLEQLETRKKSFSIAALLCVGFGFWGAHRIYIGEKVEGGIIAFIWAFILLGLLVEGLMDKFTHALIWGFWAVFEGLYEFMHFFELISFVGGNIREANLFAQHNYLRYLIIIFGFFVVLELYRISGKVEVHNAEIKKSIEKDLGLR